MFIGMLKHPTWILSDGCDDVRICAVMVLVPYSIHKFRRTLSISYWWLWASFCPYVVPSLIPGLCLRKPFSFPYLLPLSLWCIRFTSLFWSNINHISNTILGWGRLLYVGYLRFFIPWSLHINFINRGLLLVFCKIICNYVLWAEVCNWYIVAFNPILRKEIAYIGVPRVTIARLLPIFFIFIALCLYWNKMLCLISHPCGIMNKQIQMLYVR